MRPEMMSGVISKRNMVYLFSQLVPNFVQVLRLQECGSTPLCHPKLIEVMVMKREDSFHMLPFLAPYADPCTTLTYWT